jgi:hypothetical protein
LGEDAGVLDLADDEHAARDIAQYIERRLTEDPQSIHSGSGASGVVAEVAGRVAERAAKLFLYARLVAPTLMDAPDLLGVELPDGPVAAFLADIEARLPDELERAHGMLSPLAWGEGAGLSQGVWPRVASALGARRFDDADVTWTLRNLGPSLLEDSEDGQQVFRLGHQSLVDHYRRQAESELEVQRAITDELIAEVGP